MLRVAGAYNGTWQNQCECFFDRIYPTEKVSDSQTITLTKLSIYTDHLNIITRADCQQKIKLIILEYFINKLLPVFFFSQLVTQLKCWYENEDTCMQGCIAAFYLGGGGAFQAFCLQPPWAFYAPIVPVNVLQHASN